MRSNQPRGRGRAHQDRKGQDRKGQDRKGQDRQERKGQDRKGLGQDRGAPKHGKGRDQKRGESRHQTGYQAGQKPEHKRLANNPPNKVYESPLGLRRPEPAAQPSPRPAPTIPSSARSEGRTTHTPASEVWLYGHHAVAAALANQERRVLRLLATTEALEKLRSDASVPQGVLTKAHTKSRTEIDNILGANAVHQGVAMLTRPIDHHLEDVLAIAEARDSCCVVMLDQVSDPHNVGAIVRSAAAFDASAVITLERRAAAETGALAKSASGALDRIAFVHITNLARAIEVLKEHQFWVVGLEADGEKSLSKIDLKGRVAFVLGTEGEGLRRLVRESCDEIARLPITATSESLNVSNAAAVALYERQRQRITN